MTLHLLTFFISLALAGSERWISSAPCLEQCETIETCAKKIERPETSRVLCHIAACESGKFCGKKEVRSPSGKYHGPFQFGQPTWNSVCKPVFKEKGLKECLKKKSIYDPCCTSMCAAELIAANLNGGIRNWPRCGPAAQRSVAAEKKSEN